MSKIYRNIVSLKREKCGRVANSKDRSTGGGQTLFALFRVAEALEEEAIDSYFAGT
jgi:hypothetical protein